MRLQKSLVLRVIETIPRFFWHQFFSDLTPFAKSGQESRTVKLGESLVIDLPPVDSYPPVQAEVSSLRMTAKAALFTLCVSNQHWALLLVRLGLGSGYVAWHQEIRS